MQILGDPSGICIKLAWAGFLMVRHEYKFYRTMPKRLKMREKYPDIRLGMDGQFMVH